MRLNLQNIHKAHPNPLSHYLIQTYNIGNDAKMTYIAQQTIKNNADFEKKKKDIKSSPKT
jgi:hypothetical protein